MSNSSKHWITTGLVLFCGIMTTLLIRSEYFPETSHLHRLPLKYIVERFLRYESSSTLKTLWKGGDVGTCLIRVIPGEQPLLKSAGQFVIPVLGKKPKVRFEAECILKSNREIKRLNLRGKFQDVAFEITVDSENNKCRFTAHGNGISENREFLLSDFQKNPDQKALKNIPGLPENLSFPSSQSLFSLANRWQITASRARVDRQGDWMDAYMIEGRVDVNAWIKLWMSPTGELLKIDSSFGLSAINDDFFQGLTEVTATAKKHKA